MSPDEIQAFIRRHYSAVLIVVGVLLLGYVGWEYGDMAWSQHQLQKQWAEQQAKASSVSHDPAQVATDDGLTRITIPKIDLAAVVVEGTNRKQLMLGPGHMKETAAPGENGNAVITAHRDTFFRHIYELSKGDNIEIRRNGKLFTYEVTGKKVVNPDDLSVIRQGKDKKLTLITCYPTSYIGPAPERLVVFSKLVEKNDDAKVMQVSSGGKE